MTLLIISPDYASHLLPLATLGTAWRDGGDRVVVASGPATASITTDFGFERADLRLGRGSNPGVIRAEEQVTGEDDALRGFFAATERGMVPTLLYQAEARRADLLWDPVNTAQRVLEVVDAIGPDHVIVDHLAFSARLALLAGGVPHADVVLGHPTALPVGDEVYGYPPSWPEVFDPDPIDLGVLLRRCQQVRDDFTRDWNSALKTLAPQHVPSIDAFTEHSDLVLLNYPAELHDQARTARLPPHAFLGSTVRQQELPADIQRWLDADPGTPVVYVSFGSFLSVRADVLAKVVSALRVLPVRVALAVGSADRDVLGDLPADWLVREFLPQVALLEHAAVAVTHGGNNSVTESLTGGVPMLVLPFSTDQFAGAAAIDNAGVGSSLDPNAATVAELTDALQGLLDGRSLAVARDLGAALRADPGRQRAYDAMTAGGSVR
jgi:zeaxanthin glucosyltransferase